jgi:hypothetical protein
MEISYWLDNYICGKGRLLGLIDEKQFSVLYKDSKLVAKKLATTASMNLDDIADLDCENKRLVFALKDSVGPIKLLITNPLEAVYNCTYEHEEKNDMSVSELGILDKESVWLTLSK